MIAALLGSGSLLVAHVWRGWSCHRQRILGAALGSLTAILILSGYLLYYVGDEVARSWTSVAHWTIGLIALSIFVLHYRRGRPVTRVPR